jgi:two-component system, NarL family, nitrate/nitrite response regulator NarL
MDHRVLLLEPNEILRKGLSCELAQTRRIRITEAADVARAVAAAEHERFPVAVIGLGFADEERANAVDRIRRASADTACIVIVRGGRRLELERAVRSEAAGILSSDSPCSELWSAIESALAGRRYLSPFLEPEVLSSLRSGTGKVRRARALTPRERTILYRITQGQSHRKIAADLGLSRRTVDVHRLKLKQKLGLNRTAQLVRFAIREGLADADSEQSESVPANC